jgi:phage tail sheath protein FI
VVISGEEITAEIYNNWTEFRNGSFNRPPDPRPEDWVEDRWTNLAHAVYGFFLNGGGRCWVVDVGKDGTTEDGLKKLADIDEVAIVAAPGKTANEDYTAVREHCETLQDRVGILDPPQEVNSSEAIENWVTNEVEQFESEKGFVTMYLPWVKIGDPQPGIDPETGRQIRARSIAVPPSGHVAGVWARNDAERGVYKAPANEVLRGVVGLDYFVTDQDNSLLNGAGVNAIRSFANSGYVVWGVRTLAKDVEWRYVNVRRLVNVIVESISEGTRWVVFEPNDEPLWSSIRRDVEAFLLNYWRQGALMGNKSEEAFFVKCDAENNPQNSIRDGQVVIDIGIAPVSPAEFKVFRIIQNEAGTDVALM